MGDLPEYIRIEAGKITKAFPGQEDDDNTYKFIDSGASGKVYLKNTGDSVIKLLFSNDYESEKQFKEKCLSEIEKQTYAAQHKLAPMPYYNIYQSSPRFGFGSQILCYIEMKFLKKHIFPQDHPKEVCQYIRKLANIGLINTVDPLLHFYLDENVIQMIDFGNVTEINQDNIPGDIQRMAELCGIDCSEPKVGMGRINSRRNSRRNSRTKRKPNKSRIKSRTKRKLKTKRKLRTKRKSN